MGNTCPVVAGQTADPNILITKNFIPLFSWRWLMRIINLYGDGTGSASDAQIYKQLRIEGMR